MEKVAIFEKVSLAQFTVDWLKSVPGSTKEEALEAYGYIKLPKRATTGSAGYDFFIPYESKLRCGESIKIPTGIRVRIKEGWVLQIFPRSGLGFKYRLQLDNTVGVVDSDYYFADNEGHIFVKMTNDSKTADTVILNVSDAFAQGIFLPFGITEDDNVTEIRTGGLGSTTVK